MLAMSTGWGPNAMESQSGESSMMPFMLVVMMVVMLLMMSGAWYLKPDVLPAFSGEGCITKWKQIFHHSAASARYQAGEVVPHHWCAPKRRMWIAAMSAAIGDTKSKLGIPMFNPSSWRHSLWVQMRMQYNNKEVSPTSLFGKSHQGSDLTHS